MGIEKYGKYGDRPGEGAAYNKEMHAKEKGLTVKEFDIQEILSAISDGYIDNPAEKRDDMAAFDLRWSKRDRVDDFIDLPEVKAAAKKGAIACLNGNYGIDVIGFTAAFKHFVDYVNNYKLEDIIDPAELQAIGEKVIIKGLGNYSKEEILDIANKCKIKEDFFGSPEAYSVAKKAMVERIINKDKDGALEILEIFKISKEDIQSIVEGATKEYLSRKQKEVEDYILALKKDFNLPMGESYPRE